MTDEAFNDVNPVPMPDELNYEKLSLLMRKIEARSDRGGWDQRAAGINLYVLYDADVTGVEEHFDEGPGRNEKLGKALKAGSYRAQRILPSDWIPFKEDMKPYQFLLQFALNATYLPPDSDAVRNPDALRHELRVPGVLGLAAVYEAWERRASLADGVLGKDHNVNWGTLPDSREIRVVLAVDFLNRSHSLKRARGEIVEGPAFDTGAAGDLSLSLRVLVDMIFSRSPVPSRFEDHYPTLRGRSLQLMVHGDEMAAMHRAVGD